LFRKLDRILLPLFRASDKRATLSEVNSVAATVVQNDLLDALTDGLMSARLPCRIFAIVLSISARARRSASPSSHP
jgi:hypothetical protein